ncbi:MAG: hypothetical protein LC624_03830 [Halobacteriales archaeon]|nr:hypothetical protein [Halobacteriales archaeon]
MSESLPVPPDLQPLLAKHPGLDWHGLAWDTVRQRVQELERVEQLARRSTLTAREAKELAARLRGA